MIASIFNKSKPINFVIVFFIVLLASLLANLKPFMESMSINTFFEKTVLGLICYFSVLLLNFIVVKNSLTKRNHYQILLFSLFLLLFPQATAHGSILIANVFVLLGLRRILSLRSQTRIKKKLFDAAIWFAVATLFYFWSILFFVLIFSALLLYTDNRIKNWIVPFSALATVFIISISISVILYNDFFEIFNTSIGVSYNYSIYNTPKDLIAITLLLSFGIWSSIFYIKLAQNKKKAFRPSFKIIFIVLLIAMILVVSAPQKNGSEFLFLFAPLAIVITNYIESIKEKWFKEFFLSLLVVIPFVLLML